MVNSFLRYSRFCTPLFPPYLPMIVLVSAVCMHYAIINISRVSFQRKSCEIGPNRIYPFAVGILRRLAPFIGVDKFGIRVGINFEIKKNAYFLIQIRVASVWYSVTNFSQNWAIYKNEAPGRFWLIESTVIVNTLSFQTNWIYAASIYE